MLLAPGQNKKKCLKYYIQMGRLLSYFSLEKHAVHFVLFFRYEVGVRDYKKAGHEVIKLFSCSTQLRLNFFLLINVKIAFKHL